ncbi:hypothetical protein WI36_00445 [Burkholderia ubonensis]|uniref:Uncharacterized protein n=1 Tax=Burkholderia ubonensis TaxID=101571 RepID=A0A102LKB6_9BURK|nr:hypothetical protein [Burkholderia ubonensis]AOI74221.1 hypothetical protein WI31_33075 [Burkholderia ubonensis]KUZ13549.1 hypothetical protein WI29_24945 [Burkholderia ubonensis]KUZ29002.1 hypothetical protein WI30_22190 [Burkholderia ubonensis]KUZ38844.1 hypothetical protein WI32_12020 [Burkholderia ubonensis]KUZ54552.1 hypothetical protein WI33_08760 [Burkholderia ubonensis]
MAMMVCPPTVKQSRLFNRIRCEIGRARGVTFVEAGGLRAPFVLENGFDIANGTSGQGGRQFGRQAIVSVGMRQRF